MSVTSGTPRPIRYATEHDRAAYRPVHVVWEITLACDLKCGHCGSRAGGKRTGELTTQECLQIVADLAQLGTREVSLIGGEAYLRRDFAEIIAAMTAAGIECTMQSGGRNLTDARLRAAKDAGLKALGISIDGLADWHDELRGVRGSFDAAVGALHRARELGLPTGVNTTISKRSLEQLEDLLDVLIETGISAWVMGMTVPMGRASERWKMLIEPHRMREAMPKFAALRRRAVRHGIELQLANNVGYFGPYERELRGDGSGDIYFRGCAAGTNAMGIEADGTIKGCPSLPTSVYSGGTVREMDLTEIWYGTQQLAFTRDGAGANGLWGFCGSCYYADVCKAGCTWMADAILQRAGNNPYCHHRAETLERQGLRETLRQVESAPGLSFDRGLFEIVVETEDGREVGRVARDGRETGVLARDLTPRDATAVSGDLLICRGCNRDVRAGTSTCPFCGADVERERRAYDEAVEDVRRALEVLEERLAASAAGTACPSPVHLLP
jgi:radical SAM protein with 4Fe4S-binding SPASM domain